MSKRFTYENHKVKDNLTGEVHSSNMVSVNVLNALHEENQALKSDRARYEEECRLDVFRELHEENEQLKQRLKELEE